MSVIDLSMSSPISSPPASPKAGSSKRKADSGDDLSSDKGKKAKANDRVEVKGRKVYFRQDPYQRSLPRRRLLQVEGWLLDAEEAGTTPTEIPVEFHDLVVMAGHELSSSSEAAFIKSLKAELVKGDSAELLKNELLVPLVSELFTLHQYGFQPSDFGVAPFRFPAGLQIRCWEANDIDKYFPVDRIPELKARRSEREQAREECVRMLASMDDAEKADFLKGEKTEKGEKPAKEAEVKPEPKEEEVAAVQPENASPSKARTTRENSTTSSRARSASPVKRGKKLTPEEEEEAKKRKEEKEAKKEEKRKEQEEKRKIQEEKRQQRQEEKEAKERDEKKKAQSKAKQTSMFTNFFKAAPAKPPQTQQCEAGPSSVPDKELSQFERSFPPLPRRANVEWAPINRFSSTLSATASSSSQDVSGWTTDDFISDHLKRYQLSRRNPRRGRARGLKAEPRHGTVADKWLAYQEAEDPRAVLAELRDNSKFPWKTLAFDQQARPPYVGTFTKKSLAVGPRTPFAQDPVFDYSYDSGDDWQEEDEGGEDVDEPIEGEGDEDAVTEDEGEFDDWLDDAEDPLFAGGVDGDITMADPSRTSPKKKIPVKRITKLNPTWQGPIWETVIAEPTEGMEDYRIQLLNDTPSSLDPFQYQSTEPLPQFKTTFSDTAVGNQLRVRCLLSAEATNAPKHPSVKAAPPNMPLGDASSSANKPAAKGRNPKVAFPQKHLPEFLRIVDGNTRILTDLISHLKIRFDKVTTKAAIEAKIREVATREGKGKDSPWKVKSEAWDAAGVPPPSPALGTIKTALST